MNRPMYYPPHMGAAPGVGSAATSPAPGIPGGQMVPANPPPGAIAADQFGQRATNMNRFFFIYQTPNIASLAPGASTTNSILFDADSVFEWTKISVYADISNAVQTASSIVVPLVTMQIQDTGQGAYYSNAAIPLSVYAGAFGLPYVLPAPQFITPNATLQFTFASLETAGGGNTTYNNLQVQLHGFKIKRVA